MALVADNVADAGWRATSPYDLFTVVVDSRTTSAQDGCGRDLDLGRRRADRRPVRDALAGKVVIDITNTSTADATG